LVRLTHSIFLRTLAFLYSPTKLVGTSKMKLEDAISFWVSESGYRQIQNYLSKKAHGTSKYALVDLIESNANSDMLEDAIETLRAAMEPSIRTETYYRGCPLQIKERHIREGFFSVTRDLKKAEAYGVLYKVLVDAAVPRLQFAAEGGEVLLHDGMLYTYTGNTINVSLPPNNRNIPFLGNLYIQQKQKKDLVEKEKIETILSYLWCFMQSEPDAYGIYSEEACEPSILEEFRTKHAVEKYELVQEKLRTYNYKDSLFSEVASLLGHSEKEVQNLVGGRTQRRGRKTRNKSRKQRNTSKGKQGKQRR